MVILGIDESYTRTGVAISIDNKLIGCKSWKFTGCKTKTDKRNYIRTIIKNYIEKYSPDMIILERIRTFSQGFMSKNYITATAALISVIVDIAYEYNIKVYSVDTRSWKAQIVGTSKAKNGNKKLETQEFVKGLGFDVDDDASDAACISLYGFIPKKQQKLKLET